MKFKIFLLICLVFLSTFLVGCTTNKPSTDSEYKWGQYLVDENGEKITPTPTPSPTPKPIKYQDGELAQLIQDHGSDYQLASTELYGVINRGNLDLAENGIKGMKMQIMEDQNNLKKMNIKNSALVNSWNEYLEMHDLYLYKMLGYIKSIRKEKHADAKATLITANNYRRMANEYYDQAIIEATKTVNT